MRLLSSLLIGVILLAGCTSGSSSDAPEALSCMPDTLHHGQSITLQLPDAPGSDLAIRDPSDRLYFAYRRGTAHPQLLPVPNQTRLRGSSMLRFPVDSLQMKPYAYDARSPIQVFRQTGSYEIQLGSDLTSNEAPAHQCSVYFISE